MLQSPQIPEDLDAKKSGKNHPVSDLYQETNEFIYRFIGSKHPNTICWLLEIVNLLTDKFSSLSAIRDFEKKKQVFMTIYSRLL